MLFCLVQDLEEEPKRSSSRSSIQKSDVKDKKDKGSSEWPVPGKVSLDVPVSALALEETSHSGSAAPSPRADSESEADTPWPRDCDFMECQLTFESQFQQRLTENAKQLAELYRPARSVRVTEYTNRREPLLVCPPGEDAPQTAAVKAISAFYARPWMSISMGGGSLSCSGRLPPLLASEQAAKIEPARDVLKLPKIPFQAEGTARHFFLQKVSLQLPSHFSAEPILVTIAV